MYLCILPKFVPHRPCYDGNISSQSISPCYMTMLYTHLTIITLNRTRDIIEDGAVLVAGNKIEHVGKASDLAVLYPDEPAVDLVGRIMIPGLINTHMHTAQTLLRGTADDLELVSWLCERIWPLQGNFTAEDGYAAARASIYCGDAQVGDNLLPGEHVRGPLWLRRTL